MYTGHESPFNNHLNGLEKSVITNLNALIEADYGNVDNNVQHILINVLLCMYYSQSILHSFMKCTLFAIYLSLHLFSAKSDYIG